MAAVVGVAAYYLLITAVTGVSLTVFAATGVGVDGETAATEQLEAWLGFGVLWTAIAIYGPITLVGGHRYLRGLVADSVGVGQAGLTAHLAATAAMEGLVVVSVVCWLLPFLAVAGELRQPEAGNSVDVPATVGGLVLVAILLLPFLTVLQYPPLGPGAVPAILAVYILAWQLFTSVLRRRLSDQRPPTDAERERLAQLCERIEFQPESVRVVDFDRAEPWVEITGLSAARLRLSDSSFSVASDDQLRGLLALHVGRFRTRKQQRWLAIVCGGLLAVSATTVLELPIPVLPSLFVVGVAGGLLWRHRRLQFRIDRAAADRTSVATVVETMEWVVAEYDNPEQYGRLRTLLTGEPPLGQRIDRLRERADDPNPAD